MTINFKTSQFLDNKYLQLTRIIGINGDVNQKYMKAIYDIAYVTIIVHVITMSWKFIFKNKYIIISWRYCTATVAASAEI